MRLRSGRQCQRAGNSVHRRQERPKPRLVSAGDRTSAVARSILTLTETCTVERAKRLTGAERPAVGSPAHGTGTRIPQGYYQRGRGEPPTLRDW
jgi:hypothetical protein